MPRPTNSKGAAKGLPVAADTKPDRIDPKEAWAIAAIAAPFITAGKLADNLAIDRAISLVERAARRLAEKAEEAQKVPADTTPDLTLDELMAEFGIKRVSTIREYLLAVRILPRHRAEIIWKAARSGKAVFDPWLVETLCDYREGIRAARVEKAALARKKNVVK